MYTIELHEKILRGANGDRDRGPGVEYSDFEVIIVAHDGLQETLRAFAGYDHFYTAPKPQADVRKEATDYAKQMAEFFAAGSVVRRIFRPKVISQTVWEDVTPQDESEGEQS